MQAVQQLKFNIFTNFTIIAEIHVHLLANFYYQYANRHMNLKFIQPVSEREPAIRQFVIVKKQIDVSFKCVCAVIDHAFRHNIIASGIHSYFDNVWTKFMINNRTDA